MDFKRLARLTRKFVKRSRRLSSSTSYVFSSSVSQINQIPPLVRKRPESKQMSIFVKLPLNNKSTLALLVEPLDKIAAIKERIEKKTQYLVARQALFSVSGKLLDDHETLAACNIDKDSTLHLTLRGERRKAVDEYYSSSTVHNFSGTQYSVEIRVLPVNRVFVFPVTFPQGSRPTIRELKDVMFEKEGIVCEDFYLDDDVTGEQLGDSVTLSACRVPEQTLLLVQSEIDFASRGGRPRYSVKGRVSRELLDIAFNEAFSTTRTVPSLEDMEPLEVRRDPEEQTNQQGGVSEIESAIASILQTHQDCERKLTLMLDEKNKLQTDLLQLQIKYPKLLSEVLDERNKLERDLKELQNELPRVLDEKNNLQQQLLDVQTEFSRQLTLVLDENGMLENQLDKLKIELGREREKSLCNICFDKPRDTLVFSCLHLHFCSSCLIQHQQRTNTCPSCRGFISGKLICNVSVS